ncbi:MAG TPA: polysaccharide deacetylase family protein [Marinobacter sp.]|nr:polysaccharide deacetylase family protein [Marinobacter sp.]
MTRFTRLITTSLAALSLGVPAVQADLVVLQYHHVADDTPRATSTSRSLFEAQLEMIAELDLEVVPLLAATRSALAGETSGNHIAITFDDAYQSVYQTAAPLLERFGFPYTIFVNTDAVGKRGYMTWDQLAEVAADRHVTIANHSADHGHLARKPGEPEARWHQRVDASLDRAREALEEKLHVDNPMFAYPYGEFDKALEDKLSERGWLGFGQQSGAIGAYSHDTRLPRFPMANAYGQLGSLKDKLLSKAFPVDASQLPDGVVSQNPPVLTFDPGSKLNARQLTCFASGQGRIDFQQDGTKIRVQAPKAFESRRFRYNCTHPAGDGSYYWLSQQWLNLEAPED